MHTACKAILDLVLVGELISFNDIPFSLYNFINFNQNKLSAIIMIIFINNLHQSQPW